MFQKSKQFHSLHMPPMKHRRQHLNRTTCYFPYFVALTRPRYLTDLAIVSTYNLCSTPVRILYFCCASQLMLLCAYTDMLVLTTTHLIFWSLCPLYCSFTHDCILSCFPWLYNSTLCSIASVLLDNSTIYTTLY